MAQWQLGGAGTTSPSPPHSRGDRSIQGTGTEDVALPRSAGVGGRAGSTGSGQEVRVEAQAVGLGPLAKAMKSGLSPPDPGPKPRPPGDPGLGETGTGGSAVRPQAELQAEGWAGPVLAGSLGLAFRGRRGPGRLGDVAASRRLGLAGVTQWG